MQRSIRKIQWEVTKGHLVSLLTTYTDDSPEQVAFEDSIKNFIDEIEDSNIIQLPTEILEENT
jgi:uncharacterized protein (DUF1810 family)